MNEIETMFFEHYETRDDALCYMEPQVKIGPYVVDFVYSNCAIEIDGYEYHSSKAQRMADYQRERYLQIQGYTIVRFTGTEVYRDVKRCMDELFQICSFLEGTAGKEWTNGLDFGFRKGFKKCREIYEKMLGVGKYENVENAQESILVEGRK